MRIRRCRDVGNDNLRHRSHFGSVVTTPEMLQLDHALTFAFVGHDTGIRIDSVNVNVNVIVSECSNVTVDTSDSRQSQADLVVNETVTASGPEPTPVSRFIEIEVEMDRGRLTMRALPTVSTATLTKPYRTSTP